MTEGELTQGVMLPPLAYDVVRPLRPVRIYAEMYPASSVDHTVELIYSTDGWKTQHKTAMAFESAGAGPYGTNVAWTVRLPALSPDGSLDYRIEASRFGESTLVRKLAKPYTFTDFHIAETRVVSGDERLPLSGGVIRADQRAQVQVMTYPASDTGHEIKAVYTSDNWTTQNFLTLRPVGVVQDPFGLHTEWRADVPRLPEGSVEFYIMATKPGSAPIYRTVPHRYKQINFGFTVFSGTRVPQPHPAGTIVRIPTREIYSSQNWLDAGKGFYSETLLFDWVKRTVVDPGAPLPIPRMTEMWQPLVPIIPHVYWVNWVKNPHWALAEGNHRLFDAVRQGYDVAAALVVDPPRSHRPGIPFLENNVYAPGTPLTPDARPVGQVRDFVGIYSALRPNSTDRPSWQEQEQHLRNRGKTVLHRGASVMRRETAAWGQFAAAYLVKEAMNGRVAVGTLRECPSGPT